VDKAYDWTVQGTLSHILKIDAIQTITHKIRILAKTRGEAFWQLACQ
jgi:hypothetical protein